MGAGETEMDKSRSATNLVVPTIDASTNVAADIDDVYGVFAGAAAGSGPLSITA